MRGIIRLTVSMIGGGAFYTLWLASVLLQGGSGPWRLGGVSLVLAPLITSLGFAVGMVIAERFTGRRRGFLGAWSWALVGCVLGAFAVYPFGRMLIVFGMFMLGSVAVGIREVRLAGR